MELLLTKENKPYGNEGAAKSAVCQRGLDEDLCEIVPYKGGFAIAYDAPKQDVLSGGGESGGETGKDDAKYKGPNGEGYLKGSFQVTADTFLGIDEIFLGVQGEQFLVKRGEEVIIPDYFVEAARHTTRQSVKQNPDEGLVIGVGDTKYTFTETGKATYEEYLEFTAEMRVKIANK